MNKYRWHRSKGLQAPQVMTQAVRCPVTALFVEHPKAIALDVVDEKGHVVGTAGLCVHPLVTAAHVAAVGRALEREGF